MKRQDSQPIPSDSLLDNRELETHATSAGEDTEFGGEIRHDDLLHALRLYRDRTSGVLRLEASALRGPMKDVPLWTTFVNKYAHEPAWAEWEGSGVVSLAALKPPPYVFLAGYEPLKNRNNEYVLQFTRNDGKLHDRSIAAVTKGCTDAQYFVEQWARICR